MESQGIRYKLNQIISTMSFSSWALIAFMLGWSRTWCAGLVVWISINLFLFLLNIVVNKSFRLVWSVRELILFSVVILCGLTIIVSSHFLDGDLRLGSYVPALSIFMAVPGTMLISLTRPQFKLITVFFTLGVTLFLLSIMYNSYSSVLLSTPEFFASYDPINTAVGNVMNRNMLNSRLMLVPLLTILYFLNKRKFDIVLINLTIVSLILLYMCFVNVSRTALVCLIVSLSVAFIFNLWNSNWKKWLLPMISLVILSFVLINTNRFSNPYFNRDTKVESEPRTLLWKSAIKHIGEVPFYGFGPRRCLVEFERMKEEDGIMGPYIRDSDLHNQFLQNYYAEGILGLLLITSIVLLIGFGGGKERFCLTIPLMTFLLILNTNDTNLSQPPRIVIIIFILIAALSDIKNTQIESKITINRKVINLGVLLSCILSPLLSSGAVYNYFKLKSLITKAVPVPSECVGFDFTGRKCKTFLHFNTKIDDVAKLSFGSSTLSDGIYTKEDRITYKGLTKDIFLSISHTTTCDTLFVDIKADSTVNFDSYSFISYYFKKGLETTSTELTKTPPHYSTVKHDTTFFNIIRDNEFHTYSSIISPGAKITRLSIFTEDVKHSPKVNMWMKNVEIHKFNGDIITSPYIDK